MDFVIYLIYIDLILELWYCDISLNNGRVLHPIFGLEYIRKWLSGNTFLKIGYQVNAKGYTTKETRKLNPSFL